MKRFITTALSILSALTVATAADKAAPREFKFEGNPLVRDIYTADPTAKVFNGRLYVYTSHDRPDADYFFMTDWRVFSTDDMVNWTDHGTLFSLDDIPWAKDMAWAPDCIERNGNYYFYYPVERTKIGVAVSKSPVGGFKDSGKALVDNTGQVDHIGPEPIDPTTIVHKGQAYIYFGCRHFRWAKLKDNMIELDGEIKEMKIIGNENDKQNHGGFYGEAPFIFKRKGTFYMLYSNGWGRSSRMVYATSKSPEGPFTYQGNVLGGVSSGTTHGSMVEFKGQWYIFYHNMELSGKNHRRSVAFDKIYFNKDGSINEAVQTFGVPRWVAPEKKK
ncbi:MAG: family 43 glycosylhydrolase [Rikenellaceae bacterium]